MDIAKPVLFCYFCGPNASNFMDLKYRWNIIGHEKKLRELERDLDQGNVSHAYLFAGPAQIGKFSIARIFAQILQCENNFCGNCQICKQIGKGYHLDTVEMADNGESIKIEEMRQKLGHLYLSTQSRHKILLIQNIERMTLETANAMLKTLEDPPAQVQFLLTTSNLRELPATILSRVRLIRFSAFSTQEFNAFLQHFSPQAGADDLQTVETLALGKPGKAVELLQNAELLGYYKNMYHQLRSFLEKKDLAAQFLYVAEIVKEEGMVKDFLEVFLAAVRYNVLQQRLDGSAGGGQQIALKIRLIKKIQETREMLKRNVNARLALENLMLAL